MDGKGRWLDNVFVERLWRSVKYEDVYLRAYETPAALRVGLTRYFDFYNARRRHAALDRRTPERCTSRWSRKRPETRFHLRHCPRSGVHFYLPPGNYSTKRFPTEDSLLTILKKAAEAEAVIQADRRKPTEYARRYRWLRRVLIVITLILVVIQWSINHL